MRPRHFTTLCAALLVIILQLGGTGSVRCQDPNPAAAPKARQSLPELQQTNVSIPWNQLRTLLEAGTPDERPPVEFVFSAAVYKIVVKDDRANITATTSVRTLKKGWTLVPLGPAQMKVSSVTTGGKTCPLVVDKNTLNALLEGPSQHDLKITAEESVGSGNRLTVPLLPSPLASIEMTLPQADLLVTVPNATGVKVVSVKNVTTFTGTHRGNTSLSATWSTPPPEARKTRLYADSRTTVQVEDGLVRCQTTVNAEVRQRSVKQISLKIDPATTILDVTGADVSSWKANADKMTVEFQQPVSGKQSLEVLYEYEVPAEGAELAIRVPLVQDTLRDSGSLAVASTGDYDVEPTASSMQRTGVSQLPATFRQQSAYPPMLAYRYTRGPSNISLKLTRPKPKPTRLEAQTDTLATVSPGLIRCQSTIRYQISGAGVQSLRVGLPKDIAVDSVTSNLLRSSKTVVEGKTRVLVVDLKDIAQGTHELSIAYRRRFELGNIAPSIPLLTSLDAENDAGSVGLAVQGSLELQPQAKELERVDVQELPRRLWDRATSPVLYGYRYKTPTANLALDLKYHEDVSVLVAMADVCEASTVVTEDGKCITKMMYVVRNNLKPYMTLNLPDGAEVWSVLVDDRPVTPARNAQGQILIPLKKSDTVDEDDEDSYRARREERRRDRNDRDNGRDYDRFHRNELKKLEDAPLDLKPYDVEIVYVGRCPLEERGDVEAMLPKADIPTGHLSWAVFLPTHLRVVDSTGNMKEVRSFTLPFRHFGDAAYARLAQAAEALAEKVEQIEALEALQKEIAQLADEAKAQGVLPVRVEIPFTGSIYRYEKFLVVNETPHITLSYRKQIQ